MKIAKSKHKSKLIISAIVVVLLIGGATAYAALNDIGPFKNSRNNKDTNYNPPSKDQKKDQERTKKESIQKEDEDKNKQTPPQNSTPNTSSNTPSQPADGRRTVNVTISSINGDSSSQDSVVRIRTVINTIDDGGICVISVKRTGSPLYINKVDVQKLASFSSCKGFDVPKNKLGAGAWAFTISFSSNNFKGSVSKNITVK